MTYKYFYDNFKDRDSDFFKFFIKKEFSIYYKSNKSNFYLEYLKVIKKNKTAINTFEGINKARRCINIIKFLEITRNIKGEVVECGVFKGTTAMLIHHYLKKFKFNKKLYLFDNFSGLPKANSKDLGRDENGKLVQKFKENNYNNVTFEFIKNIFKSNKNVTIIAGDVSETILKLEDQSVSFVHIDVDLYEPTMECLEFFIPRLSKGGILICDDYGTPVYPGAKKAWDEYFEKNNLKFITLDNYQSAYKK